jgi:transposase-like protein
MSGHQPPFHCPYCGEEDIRPGERHGEWACRSCRRAWSLKFLGLSAPEPVPEPPASVAD